MSRNVEAKTRVCKKCGTEFVSKRSWYRCDSCNSAYMTAYRKEWEKTEAGKASLAKKQARPGFRDNERKRGREYWANLRHLALMAYGGYSCACCGETESKFLTIDHVLNDGSEHRKLMKNRGAGIYLWLKRHDYPSGFQVLCMNCNHGKALNKGVCPHETHSEHAELREYGGSRDPVIPCQASKEEGVTTIPQGSTAK